jgi:non-ribosomal peptide synthetase-like protein
LIDPRPRLLHEFFLRAVDRWPEVLAVDAPRGDAGRRSATYAELLAASRRVAAVLGPLVRADAVVGIQLERDGPGLYAAQLGVLQAGAAYVGLDRTHPDAHLAFLLEDAAAVAVVTDRAGAARLRRLLPAVPCLVLDDLLAAPDPGPLPAPGIDEAHLAYVVYTSGTTGRPKGVLVEHRSIVNLVAGDVVEFGLGPGDRVAQGSSLSYDSSVEEVWLAFATGATVVPMDAEVVRRGPDLVAFLRQERITVLCPPPTLLRTTGCEHPADELPALRLVYAGGEALPQDLADRWSAACRFVNGYGPTECTVTVVRTDVRPGEPVAIGRAVPGNLAVVLDERLADVAPGAAGELCIGGIGLARGYLGRPDLTAEKFVEHPRHGRLYRTGDRVHARACGTLVYEGRLDAQVKLRGHRVELQEVESRLCALPGVREAACTVQGGDTLVAFVVPAVAAKAPDPAALLAALRAALPAHMVPARLAVLDRLPTTIGGKLDRKALPDVVSVASAAAGAAPRCELEASLAAAFARALDLDAIGCDLDFFELGGTSVRAARLISALRGVPATAVATVRDVYEHRTVQRLAAALRGRGCGAERTTQVPVGRRPVLVGMVQLAWLAAELVAVAALAYGLVFVLLPALVGVLAPAWVVLLAPVLGALAWLVLAPAGVLVAVLGKRLLVGSYRPGRRPVFGWWYLRHWCTLRLVRRVPWDLLQGTALQHVVLRWLGARIGERVHLHRGVDLRLGGWDLLTIEDDAVVGQDAWLGISELADGCVVVLPVHVGRGATLGVRAGMTGGSRLGAGSLLPPLSVLPAAAAVPEGELWQGIPARPAGAAPKAPAVTLAGERLGPLRQTLAVFAARAGVRACLDGPWLVLVAAVLAVAGVDSAVLLGALADPLAATSVLWLAVPVLLVLVPCRLLGAALWLRWSPSVPAGVCHLHSRWHRHAELRARVLEAAGEWLSGALFWPAWLRLAGARIGRRAEISTIVDVLPEQVAIGDDCFFADGIYLGGPVLHAGTATIGPVRFGAGTFLGNHVVVPPGTELPPGVLLGVCTVADGERMRTGGDWFGVPPFRLPRREVVAVDRRLTFEPGLVRRTNRVLWELARGLLPLGSAAGVFAWWLLVADAGSGPWAWLVTAPLAAAVCGASLLLAVLVLKWLLLGRVRPGQHALWSCWCSRWDFLYVAWGHLASGILGCFDGTPWLPWYLRAMGMHIGRDVVLGPGFAHVVDPDMLHFEDGATIDTMFQAHSFEDRVLKIAPVHVRAGATLGHATVVLYGTDIGARASLLPHGVVMKHERLAPARSDAGAPVQQVSSSA